MHLHLLGWGRHSLGCLIGCSPGNGRLMMERLPCMRLMSHSDPGFLESCCSSVSVGIPQIGSNTDEGMPQPQDRCTCQSGEATQAQSSFFLPSLFIWGRPPEGAARFRMGLPASDNVIQNIPHRSAQKPRCS